jgi:hypothetical protein
MLTPTLPTCRADLSVAGPWAPFDHLVGNLPKQACVATCVYFDGLSERPDIPLTLDLIEAWFGKFGFKPKVLIAGGDRRQLPRPLTKRSLRDVASRGDSLAGLERIELFPRGRTTIEDTWQPSIYFCLSLREPTSAFFCINAVLSESDAVALLLEGDLTFRSCAAYGFLFPAWFSPLGYHSGISVEPSYRALGAWGAPESRRLANWRDKTLIGLPFGMHRRRFSVCDGFVRDVYPLMLLGPQLLERGLLGSSVGRVLEQFGAGGPLSAGEKHLWRVNNVQLGDAQALLDTHGITLSGPTPGAA